MEKLSQEVWALFADVLNKRMSNLSQVETNVVNTALATIVELAVQKPAQNGAGPQPEQESDNGVD